MARGGDPLVLIPGLLLTADLFAAQLPALHTRASSITVPDHAQDATLAAIAGRILARAPKHFALAGLSMGGYIAFEILRQAPDRVTRLAVLDTIAVPDQRDQSDRRRGFVEKARRDGISAVSQAYFPSWVHPDHHANPILAARICAMAEATGVEGFARQQSAIMGRPDSRPGLPHITCPTLVIVGRDDQLTPVAEAEVIANAIPGAALAIVERAGHLTPLEAPEAVTRLLLRWLD